MTSRPHQTYSDKFNRINALRWPKKRRDNRLTGALYFWFAMPDVSDFSVPASSSGDFDVVRTLTDDEKLPRGMSDTDRQKANEKCDDPYTELKKQLWKEACRVDLFQQRASEVYGLTPKDVLPVKFTDELGNTFFAALNENTTDVDVVCSRIQRFTKLARTVGLSRAEALRAVCSTEIFVILINQVWESLGLTNEQYFVKMVEVIAMSMSFIEMAGIIYDPVFITMSGRLNRRHQRMFDAMDADSRKYSYENHYLRYDSYFNKHHVPELWSIPHSEKYQRSLALYFNDSCVYSPENPENAWREAIPYLHFHLVDCTEHLVVRNRLLLDAFTLFTVNVCEQEMFNHSVVPNELGNVYVIFDGTTPAHRTSYILSTAAWMADEYLYDHRYRSLNSLMSMVMNFKVPGYFLEH